VICEIGKSSTPLAPKPLRHQMERHSTSLTEERQKMGQPCLILGILLYE